MLDIIIIGAVTVSVATITSVVAYNVRRSRCTKCTSPCCAIERELMSVEEIAADVLQIPEMKV
jgi:hypothetical protein